MGSVNQSVKVWSQTTIFSAHFLSTFPEDSAYQSCDLWSHACYLVYSCRSNPDGFSRHSSPWPHPLLRRWFSSRPDQKFLFLAKACEDPLPVVHYFTLTFIILFWNLCEKYFYTKLEIKFCSISMPPPPPYWNEIWLAMERQKTTSKSDCWYPNLISFLL